MNFVDEQDRLGVVTQLFEHPFESLLEIAAVFGAGQQRTHVERINLRILQDLGNLTLGDAVGKPLGDRSLANTSFADKQRVVLAAAAQGLDDPFDLMIAADQRINAPGDRRSVEILRIKIERRLLGVGLFLTARLLLFRGGRRFGGRLLADAV